MVNLNPFVELTLNDLIVLFRKIWRWIAVTLRYFWWCTQLAENPSNNSTYEM